MSSNIQTNQKRIAKNTLLLYIRMFLILVVSLYTTRIILSTLGAQDYGLYNVVGGVIAFTSFLSHTMASASQRFFSYHLGDGDFDRLRKVFSASVIIYIIFSLLVIILGETLGLWFVYEVLNIPDDRLGAAIFVYHFSIATMVFHLLRIPYNALNIAHEHMNFYAWVSIIEVLLKLFIVYCLQIQGFDKLKLYAFLTFLVSLIINSVYLIYCQIRYNESRLIFVKDKGIYKGLLGFSGWSLIGSFSNVLMDQGVNMMLNIYFGPVVNAARGVAYQVKSQVMSFVGGFQLATNPQIIKYYAAGQLDQMKKLLYQSSRFTFYLVFFASLPVLLEIDQVLVWWLEDVPHYTALFSRLVICIILVDSLSGNTIPAVQATGKIKWYQIGVGFTKLLNLPIVFVLFEIGFEPQYAMIVSIILNSFCLFVRLYIIEKQLGFTIKEYFIRVLSNDISILITSSIIPLFLKYILNEGIPSFFIICFVSIFSTAFSILFVGMTVAERHKVITVFRKKLHL